MAQIKWVGIMNGEPSEYQKGNLDSSAKKLAMPGSMNEMLGKAFPFAVGSIAILMLSLLLKSALTKQVLIERGFVLIGFAVGFACLIVHEWLHAAVYPADATVCIGIYPKAFAAVALVSYPLTRLRFILMSLLPLILGVVPIMIFLLCPPGWKAWNGFWFGFAVMGLISPYPDCYNVYQVLKQTPKACLLQFYGDDLYWIPKFDAPVTSDAGVDQQ